MLLDLLSRLRRAAVVVAEQTGNAVGRPISRVRFTRFTVPTLAIGATAATLAGAMRLERRPVTAPASASSSATAAARFAPVPLQRYKVAGLVSSGGAAAIGSWRSSRRAAEIARENERILLELDEL